MTKRTERDKSFALSDLIGGRLSIGGFDIDIGSLLSSPDGVRDQLEGLRETLKAAGGRPATSDEDWRNGLEVHGHFRTRGILGDREYHLGTQGRPAWSEKPGRPAPDRRPGETVEPATDVFTDPDGIVVVCEVPGAQTDSLEIELAGQELSVSSKPGTRTAYRKTVTLPCPVDADSLTSTCRNGILEVRLGKPAPGE